MKRNGKYSALFCNSIPILNTRRAKVTAHWKPQRFTWNSSNQKYQHSIDCQHQQPKEVNMTQKLQSKVLCNSPKNQKPQENARSAEKRKIKVRTKKVDAEPIYAESISVMGQSQPKTLVCGHSTDARKPQAQKGSIYKKVKMRTSDNHECIKVKSQQLCCYLKLHTNRLPESDIFQKKGQCRNSSKRFFLQKNNLKEAFPHTEGEQGGNCERQKTKLSLMECFAEEEAGEEKDFKLVFGELDRLMRIQKGILELGYAEQKVEEWLLEFIANTKPFLREILFKSIGYRGTLSECRMYYRLHEAAQIRENIRGFGRVINGKRVDFEVGDIQELVNHLESVLISKQAFELKRVQSRILETDRAVKHNYLAMEDQKVHSILGLAHDFQKAKTLNPLQYFETLSFYDDARRLEEKCGPILGFTRFSKTMCQNITQVELGLRNPTKANPSA